MEGKESTFILDIFKAYALAFFFTIALGNILLDFHTLLGFELFKTLGDLLITMACPVIAMSIGVYLKLSPIGFLSLFLVGAVCSTAGNSAYLLAFLLAVVIGLIFKSIDHSLKGLGLIVYPIVAIFLGYFGVRFGSAIVDKVLGMIVNRMIAWDKAAAGAETFGSQMKYLAFLSTVSGLLFISPVGMFGIAPMIQQTAVISSTSITAIGCGVMCSMIGLAIMSFFGNDIGMTLGVMIGTPSFQFGNIIRHPHALVPPLIASVASTALCVKMFKITTPALVIREGNCCFMGLFELYKANDMIGVVTVTIGYLIVPILVTLAVYFLFVKLSLIKHENLHVEL